MAAGHLCNEFGGHLSSNILNLAAVVLQMSLVPPSRFGEYLPQYFTNGGTNDLSLLLALHLIYRGPGKDDVNGFALKIAPQRGEGEKREGVQISKQSAQNLCPKK